MPNAICEIGAFIQDYYHHTTINDAVLKRILSDLIDRKSETYRYQLSLLTVNEIQFCKALAHTSFTKQVTGGAFGQLTKLAASTSNKIANKLYHAGVIEEETRGYRLSNPILSQFLKHRVY